MSESTPYTPPGANVADANTEFGEIRMFSASSRIGRVRYLAYSFGFSFLGMIVLGILVGIGAALGETGLAISMFIASLLYIALLVITIIFGIQRLHDLDQTGWLYLLMLVPIVSFFFALYLLFASGSAGANRYGNPPPPNTGGVTAVAILVPVMFFVIGILAAIAIPAYQGYIEQAQQIQLEQSLNQ